MNRTPWIRTAVLAGGLGLLVPSLAGAQVQATGGHGRDDDDKRSGVIYACYIPGSGTVYRIKRRGLPDECRGHHVEFSFNAKGDDGEQGPPGPGGPAGPTGATGPAGPAGATGATGPAGTNGTNGTNGIDGAAGANGTNGADGAPGTNGTNGTNGVDGTNGTNGVDGTNGTNGVDGTNGTNGIDGTNGVDGVSGYVLGAPGTPQAIPVDAGASVSADANCSPGKRALGGGYNATGDPTGRATRSSPFGPTGWRATWVSGGGTGTLTAFVICANVAP